MIKYSVCVYIYTLVHHNYLYFAYCVLNVAGLWLKYKLCYNGWLTSATACKLCKTMANTRHIPMHAELSSAHAHFTITSGSGFPQKLRITAAFCRYRLCSSEKIFLYIFFVEERPLGNAQRRNCRISLCNYASQHSATHNLITYHSSVSSSWRTPIWRKDPTGREV